MAKKRTSYEDYISTKYDDFILPKQPAIRLVKKAKISEGQHVLDIGCGTGRATAEASRSVGDNGKVVGFDLHNKLLKIAKEKLTKSNLFNVEYFWGDAEKPLEFEDESFDAVISASAIIFLQYKLKVLRECRRIIKAGGTVAFTSFGPRFLQPVLTLFGELISQFDGQPPPIPVFIDSTDTHDKCSELLAQAGFIDIEIETELLDYYLPDLESYWREISFTFAGERLDGLNSQDYEKFKAKHLDQVESLQTDQGILIELPTVFSKARKP